MKRKKNLRKSDLTKHRPKNMTKANVEKMISKRSPIWSIFKCHWTEIVHRRHRCPWQWQCKEHRQSLIKCFGTVELTYILTGKYNGAGVNIFSSVARLKIVFFAIESALVSFSYFHHFILASYQLCRKHERNKIIFCYKRWSNTHTCTLCMLFVVSKVIARHKERKVILCISLCIFEIPFFGFSLHGSQFHRETVELILKAKKFIQKWKWSMK